MNSYHTSFSPRLRCNGLVGYNIYIYLCDFVFCEIIKKSQEMFIFFQSFTNYELQKMVKNKRKVCFLFSIIPPTLKVDEDYWMI